MSITADIQTLEPGALIELWDLDATGIGGDVNRFHAHTQFESIWWQGNEYSPWPLEASGFSRESDSPSTPKVQVGNVNGSISALCIYFDDLVGAKLTRRRTLGKFLDAQNFPDGNPTADPAEEMIPEVWYIERKSAESKKVVEFELSSALDFNGVQLPRRQIVSNLCTWRYRSTECGYTGPAVADSDNKPTSDASEDKCSKDLAGCKLRWGLDQPLPYGGFPAAGLLRS